MMRRLYGAFFSCHSTLSTWSISPWGKVQSELNPHLELRGLLPTMVDARPKIVREFIEYLKRSYGDHVCDTIIRRSVRMNEAQTSLKDIYAYKKGQWSSVANDYDTLAKELFES